MELFFRILTGPLKGKKISINEDLSFGRGRGHISLQDPQISTFHAKVEKSPKGDDFFLIDQGSKNGLKVNGARLTSVRLEPDVTIQIGTTLVKVEPALSAQESKRKLPWAQVLAQELERIKPEISDGEKEILAFDPMVRLDFVKGLQSPCTWLLGYGPRFAGSQSPDLPLFEPNAPEMCFELHPSPEGLRFFNKAAKIVLLNGQTVDQQVLKDGDIISIFQTSIKIGLGS